MTRLAALRALLATPRDHADQSRIGRRVLYAKPDGRERLTYAYRVLTTVAQPVTRVLRRVS